MKPVSIMWSQGVDPAEAELAVSAVRAFVRQWHALGQSAGLALRPTAIRPFGTWYIPTIERGQPYWGTNWYVDSSFDPNRRQIIGERFLELVRDEPWQQSQPHWDVAVVEHDLIDRVTSPPEGRAAFALGAALPEVAAVISVFRLRAIVGADRRQAALRRLVLHHFGRVVGLPASTRTEEIEEIDGTRFCANRCIMHRVSTIEQLVRSAEQDGSEAIGLCPRCQHDLIALSLRRALSLN